MITNGRLDVDNLIARLLDDKKGKKIVEMSEDEICELCLKSREIFHSQPVLYELELPIKVCDIRILIFFHIH